jgi:hypothetical protein
MLLEERHIIGHNLLFLFHGLRDNFPSNSVPGFLPVQWIVLALAVLGISYQIVRLVREQQPSEPFLPWLLASLPVFLITGVNINEANSLFMINEGNSLFMPLLAMAGFGGIVLLGAIRARWYRITTALLVSGVFLLSSARFLHAYFGPAYERRIALAFYSYLPSAMAEIERRAAPNSSVYISEDIVLNTTQTVFYMKVDPSTFQHSGATYSHPDFGPYKFSRATASQAPTPIVFLLSKGEQPLCQNPTNTQQIGEFTVGECLATK